MKTITMYELLGLVKEGKAPKKVKYINSIWEYDKETKDYFHDGLWLIYSMNSIGLTEREVEILEEKEICHKCHKYPAEYNQTYCEFCLGISKLEEEKKIPEKLEEYADVSGDLVCQWSFGEKKLKDKFNEIIDYLDYLKSKGE